MQIHVLCFHFFRQTQDTRKRLQIENIDLLLYCLYVYVDCWIPACHWSTADTPTLLAYTKSEILRMLRQFNSNNNSNYYNTNNNKIAI